MKLYHLEEVPQCEYPDFIQVYMVAARSIQEARETIVKELYGDDKENAKWWRKELASYKTQQLENVFVKTEKPYIVYQNG